MVHTCVCGPAICVSCRTVSEHMRFLQTGDWHLKCGAQGSSFKRAQRRTLCSTCTKPRRGGSDYRKKNRTYRTTHELASKRTRVYTNQTHTLEDTQTQAATHETARRVCMCNASNGGRDANSRPGARRYKKSTHAQTHNIL